MLLRTLAVLVALLACVNATEYGYARITGGSNDTTIVGDIYFVSINSTYVGVYASISGIVNRLNADHGMHVHQWGDVSASLNPTFTSAGPHFIGRGSSQHGCPPGPREEGDMGNWTVSATGTVNEYKELDILSLTSDYSIIGRAVVFHFDEDNCINMTSSGARSAAGVIGVGNPAYFPTAAFPVSFTGTNTAYTSGNFNSNGKAVCYLLGTDGYSGISGTVLFEAATGGVLVTALISGLTSGSQHGFHVHQYGDIYLNNGTSLGDHFNPYNVSHSVPPNATRHVGDMGNVCYYEPGTGRAYYQYLNTLLTISGSDSTTNVIGRGLALHANLDTGSPTSYGARIAQCVIGFANNITTQPISTVTDPDVSCGVEPSTTTMIPTTTKAPTTTTSSNTATSIVASGLLLVVALIALVVM